MNISSLLNSCFGAEKATPQQPSDESPEQPPRQPSESPPEQAPEHLPEQVPEQPSHQLPQEPSGQPSADPPLEVPTPAERSAHRHATRATRALALASAPDLDRAQAARDKQVSHVDYSSNWAGAVLKSPPSHQRFRAAYGTFRVPRATPGRGSHAFWSSAAWVGIDGATYGKAILQAGIDVFVEADGGRRCDAWFEWFPDGAHTFEGFHPSPGDVVTISVEASTPRKGRVSITNHTSGRKVSRKLRAPRPDAGLKGENAEWIVEDFVIGDSMVPFADFDAVTFVKAHAKTGIRKRVGLENATVYEIVNQDQKILTDVNIRDKHSVEIRYTGR